MEEPTEKITEQSTTKDNNAVADTPGTGDNAPISWLFVLIFISGIAVVVTGLKLKRNEKK